MNRQIEVRGLSKTFTLHLQGGLQLPVLSGVELDVAGGECVVLHAPSGAGKSTLLRCLYGNYRVSDGSVHVRHGGGWVDLHRAPAREVHAVRQSTLGFVTQFLRVIPRVPTLDLVAEPLLHRRREAGEAYEQARAWLTRLNVPARLWHVPPATFSGGEQQRVNIARTLICDYPVLLLDEPTASLDATNRDVVIDMVNEARERGAAIVGIFHDEGVRRALATRFYSIGPAHAAPLERIS